MQKTSFLTSLFIVSLLHSGFLVWSSYNSIKPAKLSANHSNNSVTISIKAKKSKNKKKRERTIEKASSFQASDEKKIKSPSSESYTRGQKTPAQIIGKIDLEYPYLSKVYEESGEVTLEVTIDEKGNVKQVKLLKSSGFNRLDNSAMVQLKKAKFSPALGPRGPIKSSLIQNFNYILED